MDLGIVIVNWNVRDLLAACLDSVYADLAQSVAHLTGTVVVVDNGSTDGSVEMLQAQFPRTQLIVAENRGMGAGNNLGLRALGFGRQTADGGQTADGQPPSAALILNPDTIVRPGALRALVDFLRSHARAGAAAPKLLNPDGSLQHTGFRFPALIQNALDLFPPPGRLWRLVDSPLNGRYPARLYSGGAPFQVDHTLGAAFAVRAEAIAECGMFDETFEMYCEETDWHWRLALAGWERWIVPSAEIIHYGGQSTGQVRAAALVKLWTSRRRLHQRYDGPLFNAALSLLVRWAMRRRIRANRSLSHVGALDADRRAELNTAMSEIIEIWRSPMTNVQPFSTRH